MACSDQQKTELINRIVNQNERYSRATVEKAVSLCCNESDDITVVETCATERAKMLHLIEYPS